MLDHYASVRCSTILSSVPVNLIYGTLAEARFRAKIHMHAAVVMVSTSKLLILETVDDFP